jgi:hypothetical protein
MPDGEIRIAHVPDAVTGTEQVEAIEEEYKAKMAMRVCSFLQANFPDVFKIHFRDFADCVYKVSAGADIGFDKWKTNYPAGIAAWALASAQRARS